MDLKTIDLQLEQEENHMVACQERLNILENELKKNPAQRRPPAEVLSELVERQPAFKQDPVYKVIKKQV